MWLPKVRFLRLCRLVAVVGLLVPGCKDSNPAAPEAVYPARESEAALIEFLARTYVRQDLAAFTTVFHPGYQYRPNGPLEDGTEYWGLESELALHRYWFGLDSIPPASPALGSRMQARQFPFEFTTRGKFEPPNHDPFEGDPIDPARWSVTSADYSGQAIIGSSGDTDFLLLFRWEFVVLRDRTAAPGDPGRFLLYRWTDLGSFTKSVRRRTSG